MVIDEYGILARDPALATYAETFAKVMRRFSGALWVADMYRQTIEHPEWIPKDVQARIDLRASDEDGFPAVVVDNVGPITETARSASFAKTTPASSGRSGPPCALRVQNEWRSCPVARKPPVTSRSI